MNEQADAEKRFIKTLVRAQRSKSLGTAVKYSAITTGIALAVFLAWRLRNG